MARWENVGVFPTEGFDVADFEMRAWEVFEGRTVIIDRSTKRPLAGSRDEKRKKLDVLLKCDFSSDPIKFCARQGLGFADVFHRTRERRDDAVKNYRERWKRELLEHASLIQIAPSSESLTSAGEQFQLRKRISWDAERAELVREAKWWEGNLRSLEKQIAAIAGEMNSLDWESRSSEYAGALEKRIVEIVDKHNLDAKRRSHRLFEPPPRLLDKTDVLNTLERDALSGFGFRKNIEEANAKRNRAAEKKERLFLELYSDLKDVELTRRRFTALFDVECPEETERALLTFYADPGVQAKRERFRELRGTEHPEDDYRLKTPSKSKAYEYLGKEKNRAPQAP